MESIEFDIEKAAGVIINETGVNGLTVDSLGWQMRIPKSELSAYFKNDDEILEFLALRLEHEIRQLMHNLEAMKHEPEQELTDLFKSLYDFFNRKSYFLELMFADLVHKNDSASQVILLRIRKAIEKQLTQIVEQGKKTGVINLHVDTRNAAKSILTHFRFFMSDIPMTHKIVRDLKMLKEKRE